MRKVILGVSALLIGAGVYANTFKPTASYDVSARYYGQAEEGVEGKNDANQGARIQHLVKLGVTERNAIEIRVRDFQDLQNDGSSKQRRDDTETRIRLTHKFNDLFGSKVGQTGRIQYRKRGTDKHVEYAHLFQFSKYGVHNSIIKTENITLMPNYRYTWADNGDHTNTLGLDLYTYTALPKGVGFEFNVYTKRNEGTGNSGNYGYDIEAYLYKSVNLFTIKGVDYTFNFEGGLDGYNSVAKKEITDLSIKDGGYSLYAYPNIGFSKKINSNATMYGHAGAEYRNFGNTSYKSASNWRLQPTVTVGAKLTF